MAAFGHTLRPMLKGLSINNRSLGDRHIRVMNPGPRVVIHRKMTSRAFSDASNCTGLAVCRRVAEARTRTELQMMRYSTCKRTRSHPRGLLLMAWLKRVRFRSLVASSSRARIAQTCSGCNGFFARGAVPCSRAGDLVQSWEAGFWRSWFLRSLSSASRFDAASTKAISIAFIDQPAHKRRSHQVLPFSIFLPITSAACPMWASARCASRCRRIRMSQKSAYDEQA